MVSEKDGQLVLDTTVESVIAKRDGHLFIVKHNEHLYKVVGSFVKDGCVWLEIHRLTAEESYRLATTLTQDKE